MRPFVSVLIAVLLLLSTGRGSAQGKPPPATPAAAKPKPARAQALPEKSEKTDATAPATSAAPASEPPKPEQAAPAASQAPAGKSAPADEEPPAPTVAIPPSEAQLAEGLPIKAIDVAGNRRVTADDVRTYLKERVGSLFQSEVLTEDVRELYGSGFFDDIEVDLDRRDDGVRLRFLVRERPSIGKLTFEGNLEIDNDDLKEGIELKEATVLSQPAIRRSVQKIRDMYAEKGYFLAEAESSVVPLPDGDVEVKFKVTEHDQVSVRRVTFIGNENISSEELRGVMFTGNSGFFLFGSGGPFRQDAFERDVAVISALYYDRGFLTVSIGTPRIMLTPDRSGIEVSVTIDEGPRFKIRQLRVYERGADGKEVEPIDGRRNLRMMVRAKSGDWFNRAELLEDLQAVRTLYRDHGYANVDATPQTNLDAQSHEVDVIVPVERGPLVHFERIEVRGNSKTRDKVIRRELEVAEGDQFHETKLEKSRKRINALGYFERVDVSTEQGSAPDKMNVYIEVAERPTGTFQVGAGFSSIENFILTAQIQQANLFGNGQSLSLQLQWSGIRQLANIKFFEPYLLDSSFSASIDLYSQLRQYQDFSQSSTGGALTLGYPLIEPLLYAYMTYTLENDQVSTQQQTTLLGTSSRVSVFRSLPLANLFNDGVTSSIRPSLTFDTRDNRLFPTSGIYLTASSELAASALGSQNEFLRNRVTGRFYYPLGKGFVLKLNTEFGVVTSPSNEGVPIFARFFLGGIFDVRGFLYRSIGPRVGLTASTDPNSPPIVNGANIGGNVQYYQNLEFEMPIVDAVGLRGVIFTDAGNAWNLETNYCKSSEAIRYAAIKPCFDGIESLATLRTSWGFGFRWFSPLGPLRFEWGFPFKPLPYEQASVFEFTIGNFF
ncbi:MAG TPA: outer membrane protein assembly factor BamA [Polyangiaceae bacterium]|nr:outer membrane protein assembly factor BamA [Polyangiaceae bacterium]